MAIKELFYDQRPIALLDPRASQRIDPRYTFTRNSIGTYRDNRGYVKTAAANIPRIDHDPVTGECLGLLLEREGNNVLPNSSNLSGLSPTNATLATTTATLAPDGTYSAYKLTATGSGSIQHYLQLGGGINNYNKTQLSIWIKTASGTGNFQFSTGNVVYPGNATDGYIAVYGYYIIAYANGWRRYTLNRDYGSAAGGNTYMIALNSNSTPGNYGVVPLQSFEQSGEALYIWGPQLQTNMTEQAYYASNNSYIPTTGTAATRAADLLTISSVGIPASGSIYIDARALTTTTNSTLLSLKNASNQKINLAMEQRSETYNSLALINTYSGTAKSSLPLPVPTTNRERNIITWGANNYQYTKDSSRFAPSLSTSVPANLTSLSIGHDSVDPTKAFNGYINSVYLYSGEIAPAIAEALVRGELNPVNADTYSPSGPAGSLALVINTQGASASGDKVFALPAESAANDNDLVITWGDGTESALELAAAEVGAAGLSHTYPSAGIYPVWVEGKMQNLNFNNSASAPDLLSIASWGTGQMFTSPSTMNSAFYGCSKLTSIASSGLPNTSAVTDWYRAFRGCSSLTGTFPSFNFSAATNFQEAFTGCSGLTSFTAAGDQTQNVNSFQSSWYGCSSLTSFPLINTSSATNFAEAWTGCSGLQSFPLISTANATTLFRAWSGCSALDNIANAGEATSFPLINTSSCSNFQEAWDNCSSMTSFPLINTSSATNLRYAWYNCSSLTSFPALQNTNLVTNVSSAWSYTHALTSFPVIDFSAVTQFQYAWFNSGIQTFPATASGMDVSAGINFGRTWRGTNITDFPLLNFTAVGGSASDDPNGYTGFRDTWGLSTVQNFPANSFNNCQTTRYLDAFTGCALTAQSIENILVSINTAATTYDLNNGNLGIGGGTNAAKTTWSTAANTAYNALVARGWTITFNA